ncbi:Pentatricopeptide repeat-containing protein 3, mitochondrial [Heterocephalus glaber]|uniref:Pentatricopeptide repeat-containing protein 3, mitochondrial n=1 Tax=Heterocephalus glaber TaxID=10181 RepID=G5BG30_HETGA|nr:Pentatricopeptide repeat-containing protein 3, mitochondrial [Heterocephalus glaber]
MAVVRSACWLRVRSGLRLPLASRRVGVCERSHSCRTNNNAERIFALMPEKNEHSYCTMIRGMVKHQANGQALNMYTELLNNRLRADVHTFNALIEATASIVNEKCEERWNNMLGLLKHMVAQKVNPNLQTFNTILKCLRRFHAFGKLPALETLREMKAIGIGSSLKEPSFIIYSIMDELVGKKFSPVDLDDDVANRLEMIPQIWKDSKEYGHTFRSELKEEILMLMARDKHPPQLQMAFADCAADIKSTYEAKPAPSWPASVLNCIAALFLRAERAQEACAKVCNSPAKAIEVVKLASAFSLPVCESLIQRAVTEFEMDPEQKEALGTLTALDGDSSSDNDSDSDGK